MAIPDGSTVDLSTGGDLLFPEGTVLVKEFSIDGLRVETRLLMLDSNGIWTGYSYEWQGNDAVLIIGAKLKDLPNGKQWYFPSRGECLRCHTDEAHFALGPELAQLNRVRRYSTTGRFANQLSTLQHIGFFTDGLPESPDDLPALAGIYEQHQSLPRRARSYLHSNCAGCHRGQGPTQSDMDLRFETRRSDMGVCNTAPSFGDLNITGARILDPGTPSKSILLQRPSSTDPLVRMPPLATFLVDQEAVDLLRSWISSPGVCTVESDGDLDDVPDESDNCPNSANPDQSDVDRDGLGDVCDSN